MKTIISTCFVILFVFQCFGNAKPVADGHTKKDGQAPNKKGSDQNAEKRPFPENTGSNNKSGKKDQKKVEPPSLTDSKIKGDKSKTEKSDNGRRGTGSRESRRKGASAGAGSTPPKPASSSPAPGKAPAQTGQGVPNGKGGPVDQPKKFLEPQPPKQFPGGPGLPPPQMVPVPPGQPKGPPPRMLTPVVQ